MSKITLFSVICYICEWVYVMRASVCVCVCLSGRYRFTLHLARQQWFAVEQYKYDARKWPSELTGGQPPYLPRSHYSDDKRPTGHFSLRHWQNECSHISSLIFGATYSTELPAAVSSVVRPHVSSSSSSPGLFCLLGWTGPTSFRDFAPELLKKRYDARPEIPGSGLKTQRRLYQMVIEDATKGEYFFIANMVIEKTFQWIFTFELGTENLILGIQQNKYFYR